MSGGNSSAQSPSPHNSSQRGGLGWKIIAVIVALVILVVSAGFYVVLTSSAGSPVPGDTTTQPCGSPGVICGGSKIINDSLVVNEDGSSMLTLAVQNIGYGNLITSLQVVLNNTASTMIGFASTHLKPGNQTTIGFFLSQNQILVSPGIAYTFVLNAWDGASEDSSTLFTVVASPQSTTTTTSTTASTTSQHFVTPVSPNIYVNDQEATGALCFNQPTRSQVWNVTANFAWMTTTNTYPPPVRVDYTFAPFPLSSTIPAWLHLSMQPPHVALAGGQNSTASLQVTLDSMIQNRATANFALHVNYNDPFSGYNVTDVVVLGFVVNGSSYGCLF